MKILSVGVMCLLFSIQIANAQTFDEQRMIRDIAIAENVLGTLVKQQFSNQRGFFPIQISGSYQAGHGVTFSVPADMTVPVVMMMTGPPQDFLMFDQDRIFDSFEFPPHTSISIEDANGNWSMETHEISNEEARHALERASQAQKQASLSLEKANSARERAERSRDQIKLRMDSAKSAFNDRVIEAAKIFLVDYGDMITQLGANEKIVITNQESKSQRYGQFFSAPRRTVLEIEMTKAEMIAYKQGKISREEALKKVHVLHTETVEALDPDLELFSSMLNRLYRVDLSKTYFVDDNTIHYERLRDFGVIYYVNVYASIPRNYNRYAMPSLTLEDVDLETRNKKVKELYPKFEADLKDNIAEYARVLKSIKNEEKLIFQVGITKCVGCGIPSTLEVSLKGSDLNQFANGKISKDAFLKKLEITRGVSQ